MEYYPLMLKVAGRRCVVVGGGAVAARKASTLLRAGALVRVVSPALHPRLEEMHRRGRIEHVARPYREGDLEGALLAIAATDDPEVNAMVAAEGRARGVLVNVVDRPERGDFICPSIAERGEVLVAVSTSGRDPAGARRLRLEIERVLGFLP